MILISHFKCTLECRLEFVSIWTKILSSGIGLSCNLSSNVLFFPMWVSLFFSSNPFPNTPFFLYVCCTSLLKTLWEKRKLLVMSNFSFSQSVFYPNGELSTTFIKFNLFPNKPWFLRVCSTSLLKILWEKQKLLVTNNFSFSNSVFYSFGELSAIFIKFEVFVCKHFQFGRV